MTLRFYVQSIGEENDENGLQISCFFTNLDYNEIKNVMLDNWIK